MKGDEYNSYALLSHLPFFQGMSLSELDSVIEKLRLGFAKVGKGDFIVCDGQAADKLVFVIRGLLSIVTIADDNAYSIEEDASAPYVLQPERLFGLQQRYSHSFKALEECHILYISKSDAISLTTQSEVFRINVLNMLCTMTQKMQRIPWHAKPVSIRHKIFRFIENRCLRPAGRKVLNIGMVRLGAEIAESRLNVSRELHRLEEENLICMKKGMIVVHALEKLLQ